MEAITLRDVTRNIVSLIENVSGCLVVVGERRLR